MSPGAILTDIEGTTTPISFVRDTLFPYAAGRLPGFIAAHPNLPELAEAQRLAGNRPVLEALQAWMAEDAKITPLKALQGLIWNEGYRAGELQGKIYPDVPPILRSWHAAGIRLYVYSSGSEAAQRLIFGHADAGNLAPLFSGFFDTSVGAKRAAESYRTIARAIALPPAEILFLSDVEAELDAAASAGLCVCQLVRATDGIIASIHHPTAADFTEVHARVA